MARSRKSQNAENSANVSSDTVVNNDLIQQLMDQIAELKKQIEEPKSEKIITKEFDDFDDVDEFNNIKINQDDYIKIISLCPYQLNLSTEAKGRGKVFKFASFGQTKRILYSDLVKILENHHNFVESFLFMVLDKRVIRRNGLTELYQSALTKEKIEAVVDGNSNDAVSLFKSTNENQQKIIVDLLIEKLIKDPDSVDLNLVDKISRASGIKIQEKAEEARSLLQILQNPEEEDVKKV